MHPRVQWNYWPESHKFSSFSIYYYLLLSFAVENNTFNIIETSKFLGGWFVSQAAYRRKFDINTMMALEISLVRQHIVSASDNNS